MRHLKAHRKLGRTTEHRVSMLRNMATSLIISEKGYIVTTVPKAKELRPFVEKVITLARRAQNLSGDEAKGQEVHLRRQAARFFHAGNSTFKLEQSRFRGAKGTPKDKIERTAGVKAVLLRNDLLDRSVDELELSVRSYNCLKNADIRTIRDLIHRSERDMLHTKNFGKKSLTEIKDMLHGMGLDFGMDFDEQGNPIPGSGGRDLD